MRHLLDLALEHDIEIEWISHWQESMAFGPARLVYIPPPADAWQYRVGLHEFGHLLGPAAPDEAEEGRAWLWAVRAAAHC